MKRFLTLAIALAALAGAPAAADLQAGFDLLDQGRYAEAYEEFALLAEAGDPVALRELGHLYLAGFGVEQDDDRAFELMNQAWSAGDSWAAHALGYMWLVGRGVEPDGARALAFYEEAAQAGITLAYTDLGGILAFGAPGVEPEPERAEEWYRQGVAAGLPESMNGLAWSLAIRSERLSEALALAEQAAALRPDDAAILDTVGTVRLLMGHYAPAAKYLELAVALAPDYPGFAARLGDAYAGAGKDDQAQALWRQALDLAEAMDDATFDELWDEAALRERLAAGE